MHLNSNINTNFNSSMICFLSSGDMYLFLGIAISTSSSFVWSLSCNSSECNYIAGFFETLVILSAILVSIKSPVSSAAFWIALFDAVYMAFAVDLLALSRSFSPYLLLKHLPVFLVKDKNPYPLIYILSIGPIEYLIFIIDALFNNHC